MDDVANTSNTLKKVGKGAMWTAKAVLLTTALTAAFSSAVAASPALGAGIAAGKVGIGEAGWETVKHFATDFVPSAWEEFPEAMKALSNTVGSGAHSLAEFTAG